MAAGYAAAAELNREIGGAPSLAALLALTRRAHHRMNLVNCVTSLQRAAKLAADAPVDAAALAHVTARASLCFEPGAQGIQPRHVSGTLWACAKLKIAPLELLGAVFKCAEVLQANWFKPVEVSMTVWAIGRLGAMAPPGARELLERLLSSVLDRPQSLDSQGLSNIATGLSNLTPPPDRDHVHRLLAAIRGRMREFSPQEVANTLSALARLGAPLEEEGVPAAAIATAVRACLSRFSSQQLANTAWAVAKLLESSPVASREALDFWPLLSHEVGRRAADLNAQELSMCCWAASQAAGASVTPAIPLALSNALAAAAQRLASQMEPQQLATIALSLVKLGCTDSATLKQLARASRARMGTFKPQDLDNLAGAFARLGRWRAPKLVGAIAAAGARAATEDGFSFPPRHLVNVLWAVAKLSAMCDAGRGHADARHRKCARRAAALALAAASVLCHRMDELNARDLSNAAWAFATLGNVDDAQRQCLLHIGHHAAQLLPSFNAQECSKLLFALAKARVHCESLTAAATAQRELHFELPTGRVVLRAILGGARNAPEATTRGARRREATNTTSGTGGALWEDAFVLAEWLGRQRSPACMSVPLLPVALEACNSWQGLEAVELGAGVGLCSVVAHQLGMAVTATDGYEEVLRLLTDNVAPYAACAEPQLRTRLLKWGTPAPLSQLELHRQPDILIATGCVYGSDDGVFEQLVSTMEALAGMLATQAPNSEAASTSPRVPPRASA